MSSLNIHHVQDVGRILLEVGNDLKQLRETVSEGKESLSLDSLQSLISKAESDIKAKSDIVLNSLLDSTHHDVPDVTSHNKQINEPKIKTRSIIQNLKTKDTTPKTQYSNLLRHHLHRKNNNNNNTGRIHDNSKFKPELLSTQKYIRDRFTLRKSGKQSIRRSTPSQTKQIKRLGNPNNTTKKNNKVKNNSDGLLNLINRGMVSPNFDFTNALSSGNNHIYFFISLLNFIII